MARRVAQQFLEDKAQPEYRMRIYYLGNPRERRAYPNVLRSFRDEKLKIGSVPPIPDLGVKEDFDHFVVWSSDRDSLIQLKDWFEDHGHETSGVW